MKPPPVPGLLAARAAPSPMMKVPGPPPIVVLFGVRMECQDLTNPHGGVCHKYEGETKGGLRLLVLRYVETHKKEKLVPKWHGGLSTAKPPLHHSGFAISTPTHDSYEAFAKDLTERCKAARLLLQDTKE